MRSFTILLLLPAVLLACGCKDGGGISPGDLQPTAVFTADPLPPGTSGDHVRIRQNSVSGGRILLDVVVSDVAGPVSGIALSMSYLDGFASFVGCRDGEVFSVPRDPLCEEPSLGELLITRSVVAPEPAVPITGDKVILQLEFLVFGIAEGPLAFESQNLGGGSAVLDAALSPIQLDWFAGQLRGE